MTQLVSNYVEVCSTPLGKYNELPVDLILQAAALLSAKEQLYETQSVKKSHKRPCKVEGCQHRSARYGLCGKHGGKEKCKHPGCNKFEYKAGLCQLHGGPKWRYKKPCLAPGCQLAAYRRGLCSRHGGVDKCCVPGCEKMIEVGAIVWPIEIRKLLTLSPIQLMPVTPVLEAPPDRAVVACLKPTALPTAINLIKQVIYVTIFKTTHLCTYVHNLLPRRVMTLKSDTVNKDILNIKIYTIHIKCTFIRHKLSLSIFLLSSVKYIF